MKIISVRRLRGPNVYLSRPAVVARLRLEELTGRETSDVTGFAERLLRATGRNRRRTGPPRSP
jgi:cyanophycin synthetase